MLKYLVYMQMLHFTRGFYIGTINMVYIYIYPRIVFQYPRLVYRVCGHRGFPGFLQHIYFSSMRFDIEKSMHFSEMITRKSTASK